jgi:hypothetical protein
MPATSHLVDGKKTLLDQQDTLNFMEQFAASKVITYRESPQSTVDFKGNEAALMPVPFGQQPRSLELIAVAADVNVAKVISDQVSQGMLIVFHETCWVENKETTVVGVRKAS